MANLDETLGTDIRFYKDIMKKDAPSGDLQMVSGLDNVKAAILRRLVTVKGTLIHRPNYGIGIQTYQNAPMSLAVRQSIARTIAEQLTDDPRIDYVESVIIDYEDRTPESLKITVRAKIAGYGEAEIPISPFEG